MRVVRRLDALRAATVGLRGEGRRLAPVPTMGALHRGHLALVEPATLRPWAEGRSGEARLLAAARLGDVRLLDNMAALLSGSPSGGRGRRARDPRGTG